MFNLSDIKAGYLLRCTQLKEGRVFNMTVIPCRRTPLLPMAIFFRWLPYEGRRPGSLQPRQGLGTYFRF